MVLVDKSKEETTLDCSLSIILSTLNEEGIIGPKNLKAVHELEDLGCPSDVVEVDIG